MLDVFVQDIKFLKLMHFGSFIITVLNCILTNKLNNKFFNLQISNSNSIFIAPNLKTDSRGTKQKAENYNHKPATISIHRINIGFFLA